MSAADVDPIVLYVDPATYLITKQTYVAPGPGQPLVEESFSDYRPVGGIQFAYLATVRRGSQTLLERRLSEIKVNTPLDPALFRRPAP